MSNGCLTLDACIPPKPLTLEAWKSAMDDWDDQIEQEDIERLIAFDISWDDWDNPASDGER